MVAFKGLHCGGLAQIAADGLLVETKEHNHRTDHPELLVRTHASTPRRERRSALFSPFESHLRDEVSANCRVWVTIFFRIANLHSSLILGIMLQC